MRVTLEGGRTLSLPGVIAGSGARYSDGTTEAWFSGMEEGFVQEGDSITYPDCRTGA